jgi:hypothetical protein
MLPPPLCMSKGHGQSWQWGLVGGLSLMRA